MEKESHLPDPVFAEFRNCIKFAERPYSGREGYAGDF